MKKPKSRKLIVTKTPINEGGGLPDNVGLDGILDESYAPAPADAAPIVQVKTWTDAPTDYDGFGTATADPRAGVSPLATIPATWSAWS